MNTRKIDPTLLSVLDQFETEGKAGLSAQGHVLGIDSGSGTSRPPSALVFLHCNPADDLSDLRAVGREQDDAVIFQVVDDELIEVV